MSKNKRLVKNLTIVLELEFELYCERKEFILDSFKYCVGNEELRFYKEEKLSNGVSLIFLVSKEGFEILMQLIDRGVFEDFKVEGKCRNLEKHLEKDNLASALKELHDWVKEDKKHYFYYLEKGEFIEDRIVKLKRKHQKLKKENILQLNEIEKIDEKEDILVEEFQKILRKIKKISLVVFIRRKKDVEIGKIIQNIAQAFQVGEEDIIVPDDLEDGKWELLIDSFLVLYTMKSFRNGELKSFGIKKLEIGGNRIKKKGGVGSTLEIRSNKLNKSSVQKNKLTPKNKIDILIKEGNDFLSLRNQGLREIPKKIFEIVNLKVLDLSENKIESFPENIPENNSIESLNLQKNRIKHFPLSIKKLKKLKTLILNNNLLENLSPDIEDLQNLEKLFLNKNRLESLPDSIGNLKKLRVLQLANNNLTTIPNSLINLNNLGVKKRVYEPHGFLISMNNIYIPDLLMNSSPQELIKFLLNRQTEYSMKTNYLNKSEIELLLEKERFVAELDIIKWGVTIEEKNRSQILRSRIKEIDELVKSLGGK